MKRRRRPLAVVPERPVAQLREAGRRNGRFMIVEDQAAPRVRVIGSLTGDATQVLLEAVERGVAVVDLSGVDEVDDAAVRVLAWLWPERCTIVDCPRWLELWLRSIKRDRSAPP
jgi:hypothetical protein